MNKINKVAIFGVGKSGKSALKLTKVLGHRAYAVNKGEVDSWYVSEGLQEIIEKASCYSEDNFSKHFHEMDLIVISPGIPVTHPSLSEAVKARVPIISEIEYAFQHTQNIPVVAITGTNGKTTTTTMITEALTKAGLRVFCGGNIGVPYCELALSKEEFDYAVIEVSSFQLETIESFHPQIALILNIFPNHSERYDSVEDYGKAKFRILLNMNEKDHIILGLENPFLDQIKDHPTQKSYFSKLHLPESFLTKFDFSNALVRGDHNKANFFATYEVMRLLKVSHLDQLFQEFINEFQGVAHRLEFVLSKEGLTLYNDAKSTNSLATTTAIEAFSDSEENLYLILGGKLRNESDKILPDLLPYKKRITKIFTIGEVSQRLFHELKNDFSVEEAGDIKSVFKKVKGLKGNLVFSPGFPSFDQFKNYVERGEKFKEWAKVSF